MGAHLQQWDVRGRQDHGGTSTAGAVKREAEWARLDSNQEPDRYERPALTIELRAPNSRQSRHLQRPRPGRQACQARRNSGAERFPRRLNARQHANASHRVTTPLAWGET